MEGLIEAVQDEVTGAADSVKLEVHAAMGEVEAAAPPGSRRYGNVHVKHPVGLAVAGDRLFTSNMHGLVCRRLSSRGLASWKAQRDAAPGQQQPPRLITVHGSEVYAAIGDGVEAFGCSGRPVHTYSVAGACGVATHSDHLFV